MRNALAESEYISYGCVVSGFKDVTVKGVVTVFVGQVGGR
ncbi:hypothetical protein GGQ64_003066 [Rhizobium azooxidifex]|jgi:hypothetical protein|uniref:Uncharacterized protein n=1 Tax=Mycoplana azooxidifex TaxID=1636188 RepID=A0A7W6GK15_9HYPH|nr:hypothetical protein [Mycoplana azooxidifex]